MSNAKFAPYEPHPPRRGSHRPFTVRDATPADLVAIAELRHDRDGGSVAKHVEALTNQLNGLRDRWHVLVAERAGDVIAYGRSAYFIPPPDAPRNVAPEGWHLAGLQVAEAHRREGIGLALTQERVQRLHGRAPSVHYCANARNRATIDLHARSGFVEVTRDFIMPGVTFEGGVGILFRAEVTGATSER